MSTHALSGQVPHFTVAERIVLARTVAGLYQTQLAELTGISLGTIKSYENRAYARTRKTPFIRAIARACGVDETWLLTGEEPAPGGDGLQEAPPFGLEPKTARLTVGSSAN